LAFVDQDARCGNHAAVLSPRLNTTTLDVSTKHIALAHRFDASCLENATDKDVWELQARIHTEAVDDAGVTLFR
jgi:hypothetical protein